MKKLTVIYNGWGERWPLGVLADTARGIVFEYSAQAVTRGLQLSPMHHPLPRSGAAPVTFRGERSFGGLPGFVADALPDGWGMLLMDRALRKAGRDPQRISLLERLAIVGDSAIGALSFEPSQEDLMPAEVLSIQSLLSEVRQLQNNFQKDETVHSLKADAALKHLMRLGGSPQGARPKVLVDFNPRNAVISTGMPLSGATRPWLVKFPADSEHREVCAVEALYAEFARKGGMDMPSSRYFDVSSQRSAFGVERFDRVLVAETLQRIPVLSLSALLHADHRLPSLDYESYLLATLHITGDQREVRKAFERCVVNVLLHNRDDHARNFAYTLNKQGFWKLSPVFDLTYSHGPGGEHSTSVMGHGQHISHAHLMRVAQAAGIKTKDAAQAVAHWLHMAGRLRAMSKRFPIRALTLSKLLSHVKQQSALLAANE